GRNGSSVEMWIDACPCLVERHELGDERRSVHRSKIAPMEILRYLAKAPFSRVAGDYLGAQPQALHCSSGMAMAARHQLVIGTARQATYLYRRSLPFDLHDPGQRFGPERVDRPEPVVCVNLVGTKENDLADNFGRGILRGRL